MPKKRAPRPLTPDERKQVDALLARLPYLRAKLRILAGRGLAERRRQLLVGVAEEDSGMHAAAFLDRRCIVIDEKLFGRRDLARILYHEIFHFVWARLGNPLRLSYEHLLRREWQEGARGELGWPAEQRKLPLRTADVRQRTRQWADYVCESFCDSAAWFCLGARRAHPEWTLKPRFRARRRRWFQAADVMPRLRL